MEYFYDSQQTRYLEQIVRAFSGFSYEAGSVDGQPPQQYLVPVKMALTNRMTASIIRNLSANTLNAVPLISVAQESLTLRREDLQNPAHVSTLQVVERAFDPVSGTYTGQRGNSYTLFRLMPLPFEMTVKVDIWTSNQLQKYQLLEQILQCVCPAFDIQNSDNALDWSSLTTCRVDDITFSSRSIPIGDSNEIDIASIVLKLPIWLNPPAKLVQQNVIEKVVVNVGDQVPLDGQIIEGANPGNSYFQSVVTPGNLYIRVEGNTVTMVGPEGDPIVTASGLSWSTYFENVGGLRPAQSVLNLTLGSTLDAGTQVSGTIQQNPSDPTKLLWQIDPTTLPANTLPSVNAIVDPMRASFANPSEGDRYLLLEDVGPCAAWPNLTAKADDIVQFSNGAWMVAFDASANESSEQFVLNSYSGSQLHWTDGHWVMAIDNDYEPGFWNIKY